MIEQAIFYVFSAMLLVSAIMVITLRNTVMAALFLILAFFSSAVIWLLLDAEFLSIILILVYVGAVMVLFMFVVMMLDVDVSALRAGFMQYLPVGIVVAVLMAGAMVFVLHYGTFERASETVQRHGADHSNTAELGIALYTNYLYHFEIAGAILLVAIIAAIVLALDGKRRRKVQQVGEQVNVKRSERVRIVKMKTEQVNDQSTVDVE